MRGEKLKKAPCIQLYAIVFPCVTNDGVDDAEGAGGVGLPGVSLPLLVHLHQQERQH